MGLLNTEDSFTATDPWVPHIPDFLWRLVGSAGSMRLSFKETRTHSLVWRSVQEIRGISLVFREMWGYHRLRLVIVDLTGTIQGK
jgi:hypothetical protein